MALAAISVWEMALLFVRGRLSIYGSAEKSVQQVLDPLGIVVKPLTPEGAVLAYFPRLILAIGLILGLGLPSNPTVSRWSPRTKALAIPSCSEQFGSFTPRSFAQ
jgi:hypothetical protein